MSLKVFLWTALFFFGVVLAAQAGSFHSDLTLLGQGRENQNNQNELPLNGYLGMGGALPKNNFSAETNLRLFRDFERKLDDFDLYQAVFHIEPNTALAFDTGRQFISEGFAAEIIDGIRTQIKPEDFWMETTLYAGIPRNEEIGDFNQNDGLAGGIVFRLAPSSPFHFAAKGRWQRADQTGADWRQNDKVFAGADFSYAWGDSGDLIYGLWEYDTTARLTETGDFGVFSLPLVLPFAQCRGELFQCG